MTRAVAGGWIVDRLVGDAHVLHAAAPSTPAGRALRVMTLDNPALVLGAGQDPAEVDRVKLAELGIDLVRRPSGGGAVLLLPTEVLWAELIVGRGDPLWDDDVHRAARWVGDLWAAALGDLGERVTVVDGMPDRDPLAKRFCFAGAVPGELVAGQEKVVGVAQRRTRDAARFQCLAYRAFQPAETVDLFRLDPATAAASRAALRVRPIASPAGAVVAALVDRLPAA